MELNSYVLFLKKYAFILFMLTLVLIFKRMSTRVRELSSSLKTKNRNKTKTGR